MASASSIGIDPGANGRVELRSLAGAAEGWPANHDGEGVMLDAFREALSAVPMPVTVVTAIEAGRAHGTPVGAFCSLSAKPPLVLLALDRDSNLLPFVESTGRFAVNVLANDQEEIGRTCARKDVKKFTTVAWYERGGLPRIEGAAAWLACHVRDLLPGGDHVIVVGLVTECELGVSGALVYHRRRYLELA